MFTLALFTRIGSSDCVVVASRLRSMTADQSHYKDGAPGFVRALRSTVRMYLPLASDPTILVGRTANYRSCTVDPVWIWDQAMSTEMHPRER
ncbi:hypothetical protein N7475_000933 [Penicillium sp. IBT 31633x]|nr:hypothetical protein N7475_000933 [Penicillium sp. IBT 31633x]